MPCLLYTSAFASGSFSQCCFACHRMDSLSRTSLCAKAATPALLSIYLISHQVFADSSRTPLFVNMSFILVSKVPYGTEDRIRRSLSQPAQGSILDCLTKGLKCLDITGLTLPFSDTCLLYTSLRP